MQDREAGVRRAATLNLTDQGLLAKIAMTNPETTVRYAAGLMRSDKVLLARIAIEDIDGAFSNGATSRLQL